VLSAIALVVRGGVGGEEGPLACPQLIWKMPMGGCWAGTGAWRCDAVPCYAGVSHDVLPGPADRRPLCAVICMGSSIMVHHPTMLCHAVQVHSMMSRLAQFTDIRCALVVGGLSLNAQAAELKSYPEIVVATPVGGATRPQHHKSQALQVAPTWSLWCGAGPGQLLRAGWGGASSGAGHRLVLKRCASWPAFSVAPWVYVGPLGHQAPLAAVEAPSHPRYISTPTALPNILAGSRD
jgi:hypothetical protein